MKKFLAIFLALSLSFLCACQTTTPVTTSVTTEPETIEQDNEISGVLDYAEVLANSDFYDGKIITVAGKISGFTTTINEFFFSQRLGFLKLEDEFQSSTFDVYVNQNFKYKEDISDFYSAGEYVLVKGTWSDGIYRGLKEATVLSTGQEAQEYDEKFLNEWYKKGQSYAETLPITDYMDIVSNPEPYKGQRVRTAGKIQSFKNGYFSFRDRTDNMTCISFNLAGCPSEMFQLCQEDEFVVISGVVENISSFYDPSLVDCYVECVGPDAEAMANDSAENWQNQYYDKRNEYISTCSEYDYEYLARYPEDNIGNRIVISGTVFQTTYVNGDHIILLDIGNDNLIYVNYVGEKYTDPEILQDDYITFYGECAETAMYYNTLGSLRTLPQVTAQYSSMNQ